MEELQHYGVSGMKWKEHIMRRPEPPVMNVINRPPVLPQKTSQPHFLSAVAMKQRGVAARKKKHKKIKDVSSKAVTSAKSFISARPALMFKPIGEIQTKSMPRRISM